MEVVDPTTEKPNAAVQEKPDSDQAEEEQDEVDEIEVDLDERLTSVSQQKPTSTEVSKMSGRTYISLLKKQLDTEKEARENLEKELVELKNISCNQ